MPRHATFALALLLTLAAAAAAQTPPDATVADPAAHHVILENEHVRVLEVLAAQGAKSPMHSHPPTVLVGLGKGRAKMTLPDGKSMLFDVNPAQVTWLGEGAQHSWELVAGEAYAIAVEVKSAAQARVPPRVAPGSRDALILDPTHHNVILENDHVRIFEALASPGANSPMHTHPAFLLISLSKVRTRMTMADGKSRIVDLNPGQVMWMDSAEHAWEILAGQAHGIAIEVKSARKTSS